MKASPRKRDSGEERLVVREIGEEIDFSKQALRGKRGG
jgi:hypothetical protein